MTKINVTKEEALAFHKMDNIPGKVSIKPTKPLRTQVDLSLAYSPGVSWPCLEIKDNPDDSYEYTSRSNMVAVISNGTAVLGLGNLGALASKPVMEGKAVLFKRFADIDAVDVEVEATDIDEFVTVVKNIGRTWGGINLEDIRSPECFEIEKKLQELLDIPVFHDDQHGTAIITAAGLLNAAEITGRTFEDMKIVCNGAGAAGIACIELLKLMGIKHENVLLCDTEGVIYIGREDGMNQWKEKHAVHSNARSLKDALQGADVVIGLSVKGAISSDMISGMAPRPIIFAMANPDPEITPEEVKKVRPDAIVATGRSDYNNQVNNVMGFPYIFRGALDVRATCINNEMKIAAVYAIADLARLPVHNEVSRAYSGRIMSYGPEYIIPSPFDPRLMTIVPVAVAKSAIETGVARKKDFNIDEYKYQLANRANPAANYMGMLYERVSSNKKKVIFADGEDESAIKAAVIMASNGYAEPILVGRYDKIHESLREHKDWNVEGVTIMNAALMPDDKLEMYIGFMYHRLQRDGYLYRDCVRMVKNDRAIFSACMLRFGDGDVLLSGMHQGYSDVLNTVLKVIDPKPGHVIFGYSIFLMDKREIVIADTSVIELPTSSELADLAIQSASIAKNMGHKPRVAFVSFSNFGNPDKLKAARIREAIEILDQKARNGSIDFEYDGEMNVDVALNEDLMKMYPFCKLSGAANVLIMPGLDSSSIATKLLHEVAGGVFIGPILSGLSKSVQVVPMGSEVQEVVDLAVLAAATT